MGVGIGKIALHCITASPGWSLKRTAIEAPRSTELRTNTLYIQIMGSYESHIHTSISTFSCRGRHILHLTCLLPMSSPAPFWYVACHTPSNQMSYPIYLPYPSSKSWTLQQICQNSPTLNLDNSSKSRVLVGYVYLWGRKGEWLGILRWDENT